MTFGHIITTTCFHQGLERFNLRAPYVPLMVGALFPDMVDKPLAILTSLPGRGIGHSLLFLVFLYAVLSVFRPKQRAAIHAFFTGTMLHLIQDTPLRLNAALWPFWGPLEKSYGFSVNLWDYYIDIRLPVSWTIEMLCFPWFLMIVYHYTKTYLAQLPVFTPLESSGR